MKSIMLAIPVFATTDITNFSWNMDLMIVDGKKNNQIHTLHDGSIQLSGTVTTSSIDSGNTPTPTTINIALWEEDGLLSADDFVGSINVQPSSTIGGSVSYSDNFGWFTADGGSDVIGEYYLYIQKGSDDHWNLSGSGSISSTY